jgi:branched-subunit amino acid ABC-type transport system permease component
VHELPQQLVNGLILGSLYGLIAIGYTMVYGIVQLINFAHGEIYMIGGFGSLTVYLALPHGVSIWLALPLMLLGGIIASVAVAMLAERFAYRPLRNAPKLAPLITAIGLSLASAPSSSSPLTSSSCSPRRSPWSSSAPSSAAPAPDAACRPPPRTRTPPS